MKYPKVTIIVLNLNGIQDTKKCLRSLLKTEYPNFEIIVVDNGSLKDEAKLLKKEFSNSKIQFVRLPKNLGFSGGNNKILKKVKNKYIALINNDVEVLPNWLTPLVKTLEEDPSIAVVQPKILWLKNKNYFDYAGACGGFIDIFGYPFTRGRIFNTIEKDNGQYDFISDVFWASGAAMIIKKEILNKVGYFDEHFFNYMEEIDLCYRIHQHGFRVVCQPKSTVYHKVASTASRNMREKRFWEHRNNLLLIIKNYPLLKLSFILPLRLILEYISILYYLVNKQVNFAIAVIQSQLSLIIIAPLILVRRRHTKKKETEAMKKLIFPQSIVFSYFLLGRKQFSSIQK